MAKLRLESDMFELPPMQGSFNEDSEGSEIDDFLSSSDDSSSPEKPFPIDLHSVDVNCEAFKSLPADIRLEILTDLKETRKQSSWGRLKEMPEESDEFSLYQMERLLKRRNFQVSLEETEKELGGKTLSLGDLEELLKDQGVTTSLDIGKRIASDSTTRFVFIQDAVKKSMLKPTSWTSSNNNSISNSRHTVVQSSRALLKGSSLDPIPTTTKEHQPCDKTDDEFEFDRSSDFVEDKSEIVTDSHEQPKSQIDLARDFMFVASAVTHEQTQSILEKCSSPQNSKKPSLNISMPDDTDLERSIAAIVGEADPRENVASSSNTIEVPSTSGIGSTTSYMKPAKLYTDANFCDFDPGPSTSGMGSSRNIGGISLYEDEIDYIGIISDESESDDECDTTTGNVTKQTFPLEIVIQCDKEYNIEEDMFADIFYNIEHEKKNIVHSSTVEIVNLKPVVQVEQILIDDLENENEVLVHTNDAISEDKVNISETEVPCEAPLQISNDTVQKSNFAKMEENKALLTKTSPTFLEENQFAFSVVKFDAPVERNEASTETAEDDEIDQESDLKNKSFQHDRDITKFQNATAQTVKLLHEADLNEDQIGKSGPSSFHPHSIQENIVPVAQSTAFSENACENLSEESKPLSKPDSGSSLLKDTETALENSSNRNPREDSLECGQAPSIQPEAGTDTESHLFVTEQIDQNEVPPGTSTYFPSSSKFTTQQLQGIQASLESRHKDLLMEQGKKERMAANITAQMCSEAQELLRLFGLPYLVAPMEAEAQCAFLDYISLTDGTISDDSDIWLFGGQKVYKNFFNQKKHVMQFTSGDIRQFFKLTRHQMILLALLTGSDYTTGVPGVGPVTAMEILAAFPTNLQEGENLVPDTLASGLRKFQEWCHQGRPVGPGKAILRNKLKDLKLHEGFPSLPVIEAYLRPTVDLSKEKFSWALPDVDKLREFTREKFGWTRLKTDEILLPVINKLNERISQKSLHSYFDVKVKLPATDGKLSKRVEKAVRRIGTEVTCSDEEDDPPPKKTKRKSRVDVNKAKEGKTVPAPQGRGTGRGKGKAKLPSDKPLETPSQANESDQAPATNTGSEFIPQREKDRLNALKNKLKAIELFRTSKKGLDPPREQQQPRRKELAEVDLSESDDD